MESSMNIVVLHGVLSRAPEARDLPSGDHLVQFDVTVREPDLPTASVPVVWFNAPARSLRLAAGTEVVVTGRVRRRFFQTAGGTGSRTEVVASQVVAATQRARVATLLRGVVASLEQAFT